MHSSMCPTVHGLGFVHCGQIAWKKWPTNWHAHVSRWLMLSCHWQLWVLLPMCLFDCLLVFSFVGRWLLPSLVDTGDICCHYRQHILVSIWSPGPTGMNVLHVTLVWGELCNIWRDQIIGLDYRAGKCDHPIQGFISNPDGPFCMKFIW